MTDYKYIRAWGKMLGSFPSFIDNEVRRACEENAPATAIHKKASGEWATFEGIASQETKDRIAELVDVDMNENKQ